MSENNHEEEQRERCEEAKFVDQNFAELIQRVKSVMPIADELHSKDMIHEEKYAEIKAENTNQEKMRKLFESLNSGGDQVKRAFYYLLEKHQLFLFKDLGGVSRKRKLSEPESSVPCKRPNTESIKQDDAYYNNASMQAPRQAPTYMVTNIIHEQRPPCNMDIINEIKYNFNKNEIVAKIERKPPAPKKKKPSVLKKEKNPPAPKKEKRTSTPKKEKKMPTPKAEKKTPALKTEKKTPTPKKEKKTPAPKEEKKTPGPKKKKKTPALKKEKKTPATKTEKKTPAPKKAKKPPAPKKAKPPAPKKAKKPPAPKKAKKPPAPKKAKKPPAPKKKKSAV